jgi:hypothetical protein
MILEFAYQAPACGEVDRRPAVLKNFHYLYFALVLCGLTAIVIVIISLCTTPIPEEKASGMLMLMPQICSPTPNTWNSTTGFYPAELWSPLAGTQMSLGVGFIGL